VTLTDERRLPMPSGGPGRTDAAALLDREHRIFDAARIRLWLAEKAGDRTLLADAPRVFEELGGQPYLARSQRVGA